VSSAGSPAGLLTNCVESTHSTIKALIRKINSGKFGSARLLDARIALAILFYGVNDPDARMVKLLNVLRSRAADIADDGEFNKKKDERDESSESGDRQRR
jgi:hypothetical protein